LAFVSIRLHEPAVLRVQSRGTAYVHEEDLCSLIS